MKRRFGPSLYFASDKVIFDALNQHAVNVDLIRELLNERGILVSKETPKEELAQYFSRLTADFFDHRSIAGKLGRIAKRERMTYSELKGDLNQQTILKSLEDTKRKLEELGNRVDIELKGGRISALISYEHIDYTKIDFRQVEPRDAVIEFTLNGAGNYEVRSTQNAEIDSITEQLISSFAAPNRNLQRTRISLAGHPDPIVRTKFFEELIKRLEGFNSLTVTEAYCFKQKVLSISPKEDDGELENSPFVEKVTLRGEGVNRSFVISDLYKNGYYIVKVVWRVRSKKNIDSDIYELEAQFTRPDDCTNFSYQLRTVIICEDGEITAKRRSPKLEEQDMVFRLIENAAKTAHQKVIS